MSEEARDAHREMLRHARARELPEAIVAAERFFALVRGLDETPELRSLTIGSTATWLQLRTALNPKDPELPAVCEELYERYRDDDAPEAVVTAITALCAHIQVLLRAGQKDDATQKAQRLVELYRARPLSVNRSVAASQLLSAAYYLTSAQLPLPALSLARAVVDVLGNSDEPREAHVAAIGQVWVVITTMYGGQITPGAVLPDDLSEIPTMSVDSLRALSPIIDEAEKLQARGVDAVKAVQVVLERIQKAGQWDRALIILLELKIDTLGQLDQPEAARAAMQQFIDTCSGIERWNAPAMVQRYRDELAGD